MKFSGPTIFGICLLVSGCGPKAPVPGTTATNVPETTPAKVDKVTFDDVTVGKGDRVAAVGDTVWMIYKGTLKNGTVFDSNTAGDKDPLSFMVGQGAVIKGWDDGIPGMKVGGERKLHVPASLGYGANGQGTAIPANSDLEFDVKLVGLMKPGEDNVIDTTDLKQGSGAEAKPGDTVTIQYVGTLLNGKVFEDSHTFKKPYSFMLGQQKTLPCIDEGVTGMKVGGKRRIVAPPATAYLGKPMGAVKGDNEVVFTVDLVSVTPGKP